MDTVQLGMRIKIARKGAGLTGEKLSELCDINAAYLRQIECGMKTPSLPLFVTLCQVLKVSPSFLLADILPGCDDQDIEMLMRKCKEASPQQIKMYMAMLRAVTNDF